MVDLVPDEPAKYIADTNPLFKEDGSARYADTSINYPIPDQTTQPGGGGGNNNTGGDAGNRGSAGVSVSSAATSSSDAILAIGVLLLLAACLMAVISCIYYCSKSHQRALIDGWLIYYSDFSKPTKRLLRERLGEDFFGVGELDTNYATHPQSQKDGCNSGDESQMGAEYFDDWVTQTKEMPCFNIVEVQRFR